MTGILKQINELRSFLILWGSRSISTLGSSMTSYALLIWVYQKDKSTMSVALLAVCTYLPSILLSLFAGVIADKCRKKTIILLCDCLAAAVTLTVFILMSFNKLIVGHIYMANILLSIMNAFQVPADAVAVTKLVPMKYYQKIGGLQSISSSAVGILTPAFAVSILSFSSIRMIFILDLASFLMAFITMVFFIKIPEDHHQFKITEITYVQDCKAGFSYLKENSSLLQLILFFTAINLVAYIGGGGLTTTVASMIMTRLPDGKTVLGMVSAAVGFGTLAGGFCVAFMKPPKSRTGVIFASCALSFLLCDFSLSLSRSPMIWIIFNFLGSLPLAFLNANQSVILRTKVPVILQGRVFAARDTLQYCTIPLGYLLGGFFADYVFEPFMQSNLKVRYLFEYIVGEGKGAGIALMFLITGILGTVISILGLNCNNIKQLDQDT